MGLTNTPQSNRLHIGVFGRRNSGKSSLVNALTGQHTALVSDVAGTTTDPVYKAMELNGIGPVLFVDTAGFDDEGELGAMRVEKTRAALKKCDIALTLLSGHEDPLEKEWLTAIRSGGCAVIAMVNKADVSDDISERLAFIHEAYGLEAIPVSAKLGQGMDKVREAIIRAIPEDYDSRDITGGLCGPGDVVLLVMPQDIQAPKGRLILPQVQTLRELLDKGCLAFCVTTDRLAEALGRISAPPKLIITDSQAFAQVHALKPEGTLLTSFSVLFAAHKGDIDAFVKGAEAIDRLTEDSKVLIAEACTHAPLTEDIGREKIPRMLRKRVGQGLAVDHASGTDFPQDLSGYDLIIHCGACMFNRRYVLSRVAQARLQGVPITNYGITIAKVTGILDQIAY